ncbi:uncharacterized protein LOC141659717 [Apium graveolens]|uniref:uncharacterized protein LOC141659717 n=1 Tax=Apium graveolens TaxID=4045 RepID=UPI003D7A138A
METTPPKTTIEVSSPLYLHPSDGNNFMAIDKLQGSSNYRSRKRSMEIALSSKRKLGFVTGTIIKDATDPIMSEAWDTCNNMIISWILGSDSDSIKHSIMFVSDAHQTWNHLEQQFALTNGSRKYKLNKELYESKQHDKHFSEYYTHMRALWEELESLTSLPAIAKTTTEITSMLSALTTQREEQKLVQFLNGLDEKYGAQRSELLMMPALPSVETTCGYLEQEEAQREGLGEAKDELEGLVMFSKGILGAFTNVQTTPSTTCGVFGKPRHTSDKCWTIVGYPAWHVRSMPQSLPAFTGRGNKGRCRSNQQQSWKRGRSNTGSRIAANA